MKTLSFIILFVLIFSNVYGQTQLENIWLLGKWIGEDNWKNVWEIIFNDNGTGRINDEEIIFSISGNILTVFSEFDIYPLIQEGEIFRINDHRMILTFVDGFTRYTLNLYK